MKQPLVVLGPHSGCIPVPWWDQSCLELLWTYVPALPFTEGQLLEEEDGVLMSTLGVCHEWVTLDSLPHIGWVPLTLDPLVSKRSTEPPGQESEDCVHDQILSGLSISCVLILGRSYLSGSLVFSADRGHV